MPSKFKIDHNVALPPRNNGGRNGRGDRSAQYSWHEMAPGDSFFLPGAVQTVVQRTDAKEKTFNVQHVKKVLPGSTWATRLVTENGVRGVRVWRVS